MIDKIKEILKVKETKGTEVEKFDCRLNPFLRAYYEELKPEEVKLAIRNTKDTIRTNKYYIGFLKTKIKENSKYYDSEIGTMYECLLTKEILDKEYMNNTAKHIVEFLKYRNRVFNAKSVQKEVKDDVNNG